MAQEQRKPEPDNQIDVQGVKLTPRQAGVILNEMSDGMLWPFIVDVLNSAKTAGEESTLDNLALKQDHTEDFYRVQGARWLIRDLVGLKTALREALSTED